MAKERIDALTELAGKYGIDVETDYGTRVIENFVDRMMKQRFWGTQQDLLEKIPFFPKGERARAQQRAADMLENAWVKEMDEISEGVLKEAIRNNQIDDVVVDKVMTSGRPKQLTELFGKLTDEGQQAARQRFILRGLEEATWTPGAPGVADPKKFMAFLNKPGNRKVIKEWFSPEDAEVLNGVREYLRLTALAQEAGKGAGMVAAAATTGGTISWFAGILNAVAGTAAVTAGVGHAYQSAWARNKLLKLAHVAGDEAKTAAVMRELRPYMVALENQWKQDNYHFPEVNITKESLKEGGEDLLLNIEDVAKDFVGDIGQIPDKIVNFVKGE